MSQKTNLSVLVVEDEYPARELLVKFIAGRPELNLSGIAENGEEAQKEITDNDFDLVFLDINLPVQSGLEVLAKLENPPHIIFTTAYKQYALKAFDMGAVDYLLKPFSKERFNQSVDRALAAINQTESEEAEVADKPAPPVLNKFGIFVAESDNMHLIPYHDIIYLSAHAKHTILHTVNRDYDTPKLIKDIEAKLPKELFIRIHRQHIINILFVQRVQYQVNGRYHVYLKDEDETNLPVSRFYASGLKERF